MNKLLAALAVIVLLSGCTSDQASGPTDPATGQTYPANTVLIENFKFTPSILRVAAGTSVTWINKDSAPHALQGDGFMSSTLNREETFMNFFGTPGTYAYHCSIHPSMTGTIVVE